MPDIKFTPESGDIGFQPESGVPSGVGSTGSTQLGSGSPSTGAMGDFGSSSDSGSIGDKLSSVADSPVVSNVVNRASTVLDDSTDYVRTTSITDMRDDLSEQIRSHPLLSMGVAIGCGYLLSKILD